MPISSCLLGIIVIYPRLHQDLTTMSAHSSSGIQSMAKPVSPLNSAMTRKYTLGVTPRSGKFIPLRLPCTHSISQYVVEDPVVSNKHVRIYTIIFDHENPEEVAPLVYAQDLSRNGTCWNGSFIGKGTGGVLLSDGDVLRLSPRFYLQFRCETKNQGDPFDRVQRNEMKV